MDRRLLVQTLHLKRLKKFRQDLKMTMIYTMQDTNCGFKQLNSQREKEDENQDKNEEKIHIWGGISVRGATRVIMFSGIVIARQLAMVLEAGLPPL